MRLLFLLFFSLWQLQANEVILSALLGKVISEKKITVGEALINGASYQVAPKSKIQLLINNKAAITLSSGSRFKIQSCEALTCKLDLDNATAKIFNLATSDNATILEINTPHGFIKIKNSISLIKTTPTLLKIACAKNSLSFTYNDKTTLLKEHKMLTQQNNTLAIEDSVYDDFNEVFIEKRKANSEEIPTQENELDDPSDLEN